MQMKYPLGIQTFSEIIEENYLYIDKTNIVYQLVNSSKYVFLSRPRRFGKSLLISTIQCYFEGRKDLFEGLKIEQLEQKWDKYPVLRFDLSAANYDDPAVLLSKLSTYLRKYEKLYHITPNADSAIGDRFRELIECVYEQSEKRVVILIDEYDKPMLDSLHDDALHTKLRNDLRGFYSTLKECDEYIRFVMLTGVTKFGKVSVFSGLNNLTDISMMPEYNDICGITQQEFIDNFQQSIRIFAQKNNISQLEVIKNFKAMYDGYHFAYNANDIYNPYSTLYAFMTCRLKAYWFETGSPSYLVALIKRSHFILQDLEGAKRSETALGNMLGSSHDIVPQLYQAGYLTLKDYNPSTDLYTLGFPNREVRKGFWDSLGDIFFREGRNVTQFDLNAFVQDLESGNIEDFMLRLKSMFASISNEHEPDKEVHFQNMITIFMMMLGYSVSTEVHSSQGRSDIEIQTSQYIYIIELKVDGSAEEALKQIQDKGYATRHEIDPRKKILAGANFNKDSRTLTDWIIDSL